MSSSLEQIAVDEMFGRLSHAEADQARAVVFAAPTPGADRQVACAWCLEPGCDGSASRCEEYENRIDLEHQAINAPEIRIRTESR